MSNAVGATSVGDAVFEFLADTQQLDQATLKVEAIPGKMKPAEAAIDETAASWTFLGQSASTAGVKAEVAADEMVDAGERSAASMREAKGEVGLLGEEFGIHLPRHVRGFITELPGVGEALQAAFSATAVLFLIQALVEGTEKLTNWIGATFIYTEAMKEADKATVDVNNKIADLAAQIKVADEEIKLFGKSASDTSAIHIEELNKKIHETELAFNDVTNALFRSSQGMQHLTEEEVKAMNDKKVLLSQTTKELNDQLTLLELQNQQQQMDDFIKFQTAKINVAKQTGDARATLELQQARVLLSGQTNHYLQAAQLEAEFDNRTYNNEVVSINSRIKLLEMEGEKTKSERISLQGQLLALQIGHNAKVYQNYAGLMNRLHALTSQPIPLINSDVKGDFTNDLTKDFDAANKAAETLGITLQVDLSGRLGDLKKAYQELKNSGVTSYSDILQAQIRLAQAQIEYDRSFGKNVSDEERGLTQLENAYAKLTGQTQKTKRESHDFFLQWKQDTKDGVNGMQAFKNIASEAFNQLGRNVENAFAQAILGQEGFGKAMEEATADALASLGSQALVKALFYTAEGFAALAGFAYGPASQYFEAAGIMAAVGGVAAAAGHALAGAAGGGAQSSSAAAPAPGTTGASNAGAATPDRRPAGGINAQHLAVGGLITAPTLAILGERKEGDPREVVIPLGDSRAKQQIGDALGSGDGGPIIHQHFHINGMISADTMQAFVGKINDGVRKNTIHLKSSTTYRLNRRSQ